MRFSQPPICSSQQIWHRYQALSKKSAPKEYSGWHRHYGIVAKMKFNKSQVILQVAISVGVVKLRVPADVAVIGFDNISHIAEGLQPALTTMQLPHYEMGRWAVQYLMDNRGKELEPVQAALPCPLVRRESV